MLDLIASQHIERRRPAITLYNGSLAIGDIKQHPARRKPLRGQKPPRMESRPQGEEAVRQGLFGRALKMLQRDPGRVSRKRPFAGASAEATGAQPPLADGAVPVGEENPRAKFLGYFFRSLLPLLFLLVAGLCFFFFSDWSLPAETGVDPGGILREDALVRHDMAFYAGLLAERQESGGEDIPLDLVEAFRWETYVVRRGDSVERIAREHNLSIDAIIAGNNITNAHRLFQGQEIRIPNMDGIPYTVRRGDNLLRIAESRGVPLPAILDANDLDSDTITPGMTLFIPGARMKREDLKLALGELFIYPVRGRLTSPFGWRNDPIARVRRYHAAIDLAVPEGTMIRAAMDGRVASAGNNATYGKFVILAHSGGYQTLYAHMSVISAGQGDWVAQGAKIGEAGSTGYSTGPHLHFAVYKNGRAVNPLEFLHQ